MNHHEDAAANGLADLVFVCIVIAIFLTVKYIEAVVRAWLINPYFRPLWLATGFAMLMTIVAYLTNFQDQIINGLYSLAHLFLFVLSKAMDIYYNDYVQKEVSKDSIVDQVKHGPWWSPQPH